MAESVLLIVGAYLVGSIPSGYLLSRYIAGIDIRDYGSGNAGASNVIAHVGPRTGMVQGAFDCLVKGAVPVFIASQVGASAWVLAAVVFAAISGHNWSVFLRFTGGRGVATAIGAALALMMWREVLILGLITLVVGRIITKDTGFWTFIAVLLLPALAAAFRQPMDVVLTAAVIGLLLVAKRLTANWEPIPAGYGIVRVLGYRLLWDRDVPKRAEWTSRRPPLP